MTGDQEPDLLQFYADHFRPGAVDLSASCPPPTPIEGFDHQVLHGEDLAFVPPSGAPALRECIAARYASLGPDDIRISTGASEALAALAFSVLEPGATAWLAPGAYPSFREAASKVGAELTWGELIPRGARLALACNPAARDGGIVDLDAFLAACDEAGALPVMDEVYRDLHLPQPLPSVVDIRPSALSIGDLSKPLGLGGIRIGWVATADHNVLERLDRELQLLSGGPSSLSVTAAAAAFGTFDEVVTETMRAARRNQPLLVKVLHKHGWDVVLPEAGLTMLGIPGRPVTGEDLRRLEDGGFFLLAGETIDAPGAFRITLLRDAETLDRALTILEKRP